MNKKRILSVILSGALLSSSVCFFGCAKNGSANLSNLSSSGAKSEAASPAAPAEPIRLFMGTAGLSFPDGTGPSDNVYINKIAELANVKFSEVICPEYSDFQTKFNLMFSTNDIPDLVHCWFPADVQTQGEAGAFMELSNVIASSSVLSKTYSASMLNLMKNEKNHIFALRALAAVDGTSLGVNSDLIDELNGGTVPSTPDDWYTLMKKEKAKYPDSIPLSGRTGLRACDMFFKAYGVSVTYGEINWQYKDGKIIHAFQAPMMKDAIQYYQKLYQEGLLDKTFVTNTSEDWNDRKDNKKLLLFVNNINSCIKYPTIPAALPRVEDSRVTDDDAYTARDLLGGHCLAMSAKTEHKDAVIRVMETLLSDDVKQLSSWGIEGTDFKVENNQKVLTETGNKMLPLRSMMFAVLSTKAAATFSCMPTVWVFAKM